MDIGYIFDDGGRVESGRTSHGLVDCVVRALAIGCYEVYADVYAELYDMGWRTTIKAERIACGLAYRSGVLTQRKGSRRLEDEYLIVRRGWAWTPTMHIGSGCTVHLGPDPLPDRCIVRLSCHLAAIIGGVVHDNHDPRRGGTRCVYGYWHLPATA